MKANHIKSIVTLEDQIDLERKGQQSFQGVVYARLIAFGNGGLHALYDKTDGYLQFETGKKISSTDFYNIYVSWCEDNLEKPRASAGFLHYIKENQKRYGLIYDAKCIGIKHLLTDRGKYQLVLLILICREQYEQGEQTF